MTKRPKNRSHFLQIPHSRGYAFPPQEHIRRVGAPPSFLTCSAQGRKIRKHDKRPVRMQKVTSFIGHRNQTKLNQAHHNRFLGSRNT